LLRKALIRAAKTSHTAGTLCAMPPNMVCKYIGIKNYDNAKEIVSKNKKRIIGIK
jgi:hypothetical protein